MKLLIQAREGAGAGRRLEAAKAIEQLVEDEDNCTLVAAMGEHSAGPIVELMRTGSIEERTVAVQIIRKICRVSRFPCSRGCEGREM